MERKYITLIGIAFTILIGIYYLYNNTPLPMEENQGGPTENEQVLTHPLMISEMRKQAYPGSEIAIEQTLPQTSTYSQYLVSYMSDGNKIFALLTIPKGEKPERGFPVIIFNHGYIPPAQYRTTERYTAYVDGFARNGFIIFKPDYRGHGNSEGEPLGTYYSPAYTVDVLNAVSSIKRYKDANPNRIGMWGHSMGGHIVLRSMVVSPDIKAGVIWAGVVASYEDMMTRWRRRIPWRPSTQEQRARRPGRQDLIDQFGTTQNNPEFWHSITPINFVSDISGPVQLHHGLSDEDVPWEFSQSLKVALERVSKEVEYYTYEGAGHNLSGAAFGQAMSRSVEFFKKHLTSSL